MNEEHPHENRPDATLYVIGSVCGALLLLGPLWGAFGTVWGMTGAFRRVVAEGQVDKVALAGDLTFSVLCAVGGLLMCPIGIVVFTICLIGAVRLRQLEKGNQPPA